LIFIRLLYRCLIHICVIVLLSDVIWLPSQI